MVIQRLRMNKKGVEIRSIFYTLGIMSLFIIATGVIISGWQEEYNSNVATSDIAAYNKLNDVAGIANEQKNSITPDNPQATETVEDASYRGSFGILANLFSSLDMVFGSNGIIQTATTQLGIPFYITQTILILGVLAVAFAIIAVIFRQSARSSV
jgi:hypothetical protein